MVLRGLGNNPVMPVAAGIMVTGAALQNSVIKKRMASLQRARDSEHRDTPSTRRYGKAWNFSSFTFVLAIQRSRSRNSLSHSRHLHSFYLLDFTMVAWPYHCTKETIACRAWQ